MSRAETNICLWPTVFLHSLESWGLQHTDVLWPLIEPFVLPMSKIIPQIKRKPRNICLRTTGNSSTRGMHTLPLDVQLLIFEALDNLRDVTALCLTNSDLMIAGLRRVEKLSRFKWSTWLGDRIFGTSRAGRSEFLGAAPPKVSQRRQQARCRDQSGGRVRGLPRNIPAL